VGDEPVNKEQEDEAEGHQERQAKRGRERKRFNPVEAWKVVRAGLGFWDPKVQWEAIGKNVGDGYDEVSSISSLHSSFADHSVGIPRVLAEPPRQRSEAPHSCTVSRVSCEWRST
jgi:hypothetical protein